MTTRIDCWLDEFREIEERAEELKKTLPDEYHEMVEVQKKNILEGRIWGYLEG